MSAEFVVLMHNNAYVNSFPYLKGYKYIEICNKIANANIKNNKRRIKKCKMYKDDITQQHIDI